MSRQVIRPKDVYMLAYMWQRANMRGRVTWEQYCQARDTCRRNGWGQIWDAADNALRDKVRAGAFDDDD